jgi:hypothetical protein
LQADEPYPALARHLHVLQDVCDTAHLRAELLGGVNLIDKAGNPLGSGLDTDVDPGVLKVLQVRQEHVGSTYALHHAMVHAVVAEPFTVSLVLRGPAVKDRFLVMDRITGESWWQYGASQESTDNAEQKRMSAERLRELTGWLRDWDLF